MIQPTTYQEVTAMYIAIGWGCKCCGRLNSVSWNECEGDTYCEGCKNHMKAEMADLVFSTFPQGAPCIVQPDPDSQGFEVAAAKRMEHEAIFGYLPSYTGDGFTG